MERLHPLDEWAEVLAAGGSHFETLSLGEVACQGRRLPIQAVAMGNPDRQLPAVGFFGGFHGLELIGAEVVLAYLRSLAARLRWDGALHRLLETVRLVFMPLVNPGGMLRGTRANPNGVDLMRNAPVDSLEPVPWLIGGQRLSPRLPWFRGRPSQAMEPENQAVCALVEAEFLGRPFSLTLDCHSGFGVRDRIWFPYAHTRRPIAQLAELHALGDLLQETLCNHRYVFEPQSSQYLAHGDLWDHLHLRSLARPGQVFLPMTLELGSWAWVKKNPRLIFRPLGIFNPLIEHRQRRVLRSHLSLLEFLVHAGASQQNWLPTGADRDRQQARALARWYPDLPAPGRP